MPVSSAFAAVGRRRSPETVKGFRRLSGSPEVPMLVAARRARDSGWDGTGGERERSGTSLAEYGGTPPFKSASGTARADVRAEWSEPGGGRCETTLSTAGGIDSHDTLHARVGDRAWRLIATNKNRPESFYRFASICSNTLRHATSPELRGASAPQSTVGERAWSLCDFSGCSGVCGSLVSAFSCSWRLQLSPPPRCRPR